MKKLFIAALATLFAGNALAIDNEPEPGFSTQVVMGMTASKVNGLDDYSGKAGATLGVKFDYMLPNAHGTYINAGLDWAMKGAKMTYNWSTPVGVEGIPAGMFEMTNKIPTHYIELPIHVGFRYNVTEDFGLYGEVGPYFAFGLTGKSKTSIDADGSWTKNYESSYSIFKKSTTQANFQRWDAGIGLRIGAEYNRYSLNLGCDWGLTDMWRDSYRDAIFDATKLPLDKLHNFNLSIAFGVRF